MDTMRTTPRWLNLLFILCLLMPVFFLLTMPGGTMMGGIFWFWMILLLCFWMMGSMTATDREADDGERPRHKIRMLSTEEQPSIIRRVMDVRLATENHGVSVFRGPLLEPADQALNDLQKEFEGRNIPLIQEDDELGNSIILMPQSVEQAVLGKPTRPWIHWLLFGLTFLTTTWAGAMHQGVNLVQEPGSLVVGLPYSIGLMLILGVHELGHYFMAKRHGINVTPPFFIPVPFALGTFGAFIQMKSPTKDRRSLFDVAVAGPIAGLVIAIPALLIGLQSSQVLSPGAAVADGGHSFMHGTSVGSSLLFAMLSKAVLGGELQYGYMLQLSPLAFAGWLGLLVTALNLLPVGQLDGGHMARAMFGRRIGETISSVAMWSLFLLAIFVWPGLMLWAIIVYFIAGRGTPPLNDITPISNGRRWVGYATFLILAMILIPLPHAFWQAAEIYCPYL
ncbi:site-2 protease family protein [Botrimarina mediterranea]|uniref:site-2 protease family protein n=1 Tax=Botrimarina mediterranea TaxID=2528022 RepID=UPI00118CBB9C|nr:Peptidase family M50 [Planctomycetes bacterium K2D]